MRAKRININVHARSSRNRQTAEYDSRGTPLIVVVKPARRRQRAAAAIIVLVKTIVSFHSIRYFLFYLFFFSLYSPPRTTHTTTTRVAVTEGQKITYAAAASPHTHGRKPVVHTPQARALAEFHQEKKQHSLKTHNTITGRFFFFFYLIFFSSTRIQYV